MQCFYLLDFLGLLVYADETQEQQVERLIRELQDVDSDVRSNAAVTLGDKQIPVDPVRLLSVQALLLLILYILVPLLLCVSD